jgi:hypothetical protein
MILICSNLCSKLFIRLAICINHIIKSNDELLY